MINKVVLVGRLGQVPELRQTDGGDPMAHFSIATTEAWKDKKTGEKREKTTWHRCVAWRKTAESCAEYMKKGKLYYVEGSIEISTYEKDGQQHHSCQVRADLVKFL